MSDLVQFIERGFIHSGGAIDWVAGEAYLVTPKNRRRILDRDNTESRDDGWSYQHTPLDGDVTVVTRIRWEDRVLYDEVTLARVVQPWTRVEVAS